MGKKIGAGKKVGKIRERDAKGRYVSPINGQPVPDSPSSHATRFRAGDSRAREAQKKSAAAQKEKGDLRKLCQLWMQEEVATGKDGEKITGGQMMVRVAVKEVAKGNSKFWELLRDTAGFKPVDKVVMAEVDPNVIDEVEQMVKEAGNDQEDEP
jgi:hypothetical protein